MRWLAYRQWYAGAPQAWRRASVPFPRRSQQYSTPAINVTLVYCLWREQLTRRIQSSITTLFSKVTRVRCLWCLISDIIVFLPVKVWKFRRECFFWCVTTFLLFYISNWMEGVILPYKVIYYKVSVQKRSEAWNKIWKFVTLPMFLRRALMKSVTGKGNINFNICKCAYCAA